MEEKIIEFVRQNKCLYDKKDAKYKNIYIKNKLFHELGIQLKIEPEKIKSRWKTLRDKFQREIKNEQKSSGSGATSPKKEWKWLASLMFLKDVDSVNERAVGNFARVNEEEEVPYVDLCVDEELLNSDVSVTETQQSDSSLLGSRSKRQTKADIALESASSQLAEIMSLAKSTFQIPQPPESPAQTFFKGIAAQVDDAKISPEKFTKLQIEVLKVVRENLFSNN